jgi:hypothetical protein
MRQPCATRLAGLSFSRHWLGGGVCDFPVGPDLRAGRAPIIWLPPLDPDAVLITSAIESFNHARSVWTLKPTFKRRAPDGDYWLAHDGHHRLPLVLVGGASAATPAAVLIPLDADFAERSDAALRLWRIVTGRPRRRSPDPLTSQRRQRLALTLRVLDGRLAGATHRAIAQGLFGSARIPTGPSWKAHDLRDRTRRLARAGFALMQGGYLDLLRSPRHRSE